MKKIILLCFLFNVLNNFSYAQVININPDPNGPPWLTGGVPLMSPEVQQRFDEIPVMTRKSLIEPPSSVDNSQNKFMRPIFVQSHGCCSQASGVAYVFTYEINYLRDLSANEEENYENQYPSHFTYNFLNSGNGGNGSWVDEGWDIIIENGCPNIATYGSMNANGNATHWMSGYNSYYDASKNRIDGYETIDLSIPEEALANMKQWLFNHNDDNNQYGGLISFTTNMQACDILIIQPPLPEYGKTYLNEYANPVEMNHQLTIVGFDDDICL